MRVKMQFPTGVGFFTDKYGVRQAPDALGQIEINNDDLGLYLLAGFFPATLMTTIFDFSSEIDAQVVQAAAMSGDLSFFMTPATLNTPAGAAANRTVTIELKNTVLANHIWFNAAIVAGVSIAKSSVGGTATIASTTLAFIEGVATVAITIGGVWLAGDTITLTVAALVVLGYTVAEKTSVETMV
jgi:hypothetical protein